MANGIAGEQDCQFDVTRFKDLYNREDAHDRDQLLEGISLDISSADMVSFSVDADTVIAAIKPGTENLLCQI